jgi:pyrroline-5-carboxylate reductase
MEKLGFIGMGNMALALAGGFIKSGKINKNDIYAFAPNQEKLNKNAQALGFIPCKSLNELVSSADTFVMACKPYQINDVLKEIGTELSGKALISVAAGWGLKNYEEFFSGTGKVLSAEAKMLFNDSVRIQCIMPNTPALVGEGVMLFEKENSLTPEEHAQIVELFSSLGIVEELPSNLMGIGGAVSGCGPAFVDLMMEAYADAAVKYGIPRPTAYKIVAQTILGSAKLQKETGKHPAVLKDEVCSPNGTTICGVATLEKEGFRNACIASIDAIMNKKK